MTKIRVHSKRDPFYRGGVKFGKEPVTLDTDTVSKERLEQIEAEPMLIVERVEEKAPAKSSGGQSGGSAKS